MLRPPAATVAAAEENRVKGSSCCLTWRLLFALAAAVFLATQTCCTCSSWHLILAQPDRLPRAEGESANCPLPASLVLSTSTLLPHYCDIVINALY